MKKLLPLLSSLIVMSSLSADLSIFSNSKKPESTKQSPNVITPSTSPIVKNGVDVTVAGDFIWWKSMVSQLEYVITGIQGGTDTDATADVGRGYLKSPKYEFQPGFKVALAVLPNFDGWDLNFQYTWLNEQWTNNSIETSDTVGGGVPFDVAFPTGFYNTVYVASASANWKQSFNTLDTELGREFFISKFLTLRPHVGTKFAWIDAKLDLLYNTLPDSENFVFDTALTQDMWGLGVRAGVDSVWRLTKNWGIYGDAAFTTVWSFFHTREKQLATSSDTPPIYTINISEKVQRIMNVVELSLGLRYMTWINEDRYQFSVQAGWEEQIWMGFNNFINVGELLVGNLSLQGLTIKAGFAF